MARFFARRCWLVFGWGLALAGALGATPPAGAAETAPARRVEWWITTESLAAQFSQGPAVDFRPGEPPATSTAIDVDGKQTFQSIVGIGSSLEHSTCHNLSLLPADRREEVLVRLLDVDRGIGMSMMRICIGTPDFTASPWYSYDDVPAGQSDPELKRFSIDKDRQYVLPILHAARRINPELKLLASPWSPPAWMKTNGDLRGGSLDPRHYGSFARYLVRFLEAYAAEGLPIDAMTIQNEPEYNPETYPTCGWTAPQQRAFIRDHLGPLLAEKRIPTLLWCFDHNFNSPGFPATIYADLEAAQYVDGAAFHHYEGDPSAMSEVHAQYPDKHLYFTEGSTFGLDGAGQIIAFFRNWARSYNAWVTMIDHRGEPNPGPHDCSPTCIVLNSETLEVQYRFDFSMYGHFSKFVRPGAVRIASTEAGAALRTIAFRNPDGSIVLVAVNRDARPRDLALAWNGQYAAASLPPRSLATFRWQSAP